MRLTHGLLLQYAVSIVNSGLYRDDADGGEELTYTGDHTHCSCLIDACSCLRTCTKLPGYTATLWHAPGCLNQLKDHTCGIMKSRSLLQIITANAKMMTTRNTPRLLARHES